MHAGLSNNDVNKVYVCYVFLNYIFEETYRIIEDGITVSGLDSGACMATQVHLTYSSIVKGVGMFAGGQ